MKILPVALACLLGLNAGAALRAQEDIPGRVVVRPKPNLPGSPPAPSGYTSVVVETLLADYGKAIGKKVVLDNSVQGTLTLPDVDGLDAPAKIRLIEKALFLNGFTLIDGADGVVEVLGLGKPVRSAGLPLYTKSDELPQGERVFSYLLKLEHRDALEIAAVLQQYIPPSNGVAFTADKGSRILIATGPTSIIRTVIKVVAALDAPAEAAH